MPRITAANRERRLQSELKQVHRAPSPGVMAGIVGDDLMLWKAVISGTQGTPYEGGVFFLKIQVPYEYPFKPPKITFTTRLYHPNVNSNGGICLDVLGQQWSPAMTVPKALLAVQSLMGDPTHYDALVPVIGKQLRDNREEFEKTAKEWTQKYAA
eukprot:TRINITY_DN6751_c0_g1_i1.p1 TRINITY_DN6751_c0_g1~~TRINITY_DN6751_c0_g1_i1.p1  ORF type:complete len:167 (+),score=27.74 TRINITY_DN6751_c0_g1_i1:38-502(+)